MGYGTGWTVGTLGTVLGIGRSGLSGQMGVKEARSLRNEKISKIFADMVGVGRRSAEISNEMS